MKVNCRHLLQVLASQQVRVNLVNLAHPEAEEASLCVVVFVFMDRYCHRRKYSIHKYKFLLEDNLAIYVQKVFLWEMIL